jgi:flagellar M-ring protein FliF
VAEFTDQVKAFYERLEPTQRRVLWAAIAAALLVVVGVGAWASRTPYAVLTRAGTGDEAAALTRSLSVAGIPFEVGSDGRTILVPEEMEVDARRAASSDEGIVGLEGLEQIDPWVSPFQEQLHRQRMLQGELVRVINSIDGIAASSVALNLPERAAFLREEARSTAAVTVRPDEGASVSRESARAIAQLVSHSVSGMTADDVSVVDASSGRLLWAGAANDPNDPANGDLAALAARRETALADGVRAALARILGSSGAAAVTVNVELETSAVQSTTSEIDPDSAAPAKERTETEANGAATSSAVGVPGTDSNLPERSGAGGSGASGRKRDSQETTYQYSQTQTTTVRPAGDIRRLSASVMIDTAALKAVLGEGAKPEDEVQLRSQLEAAVKAALGASSKRSDDVVVTFVSFAPTQLAEELPAEVPVAEVVERWAPEALALLAVALAFVFVVRPLVAAVRPPPSVAVAGAGALAGGVTDGEDAEGGTGEGSANTPMPDADGDEDELTTRIRRHVERFQSLQPQHVSELVRRESQNSAEVVRRWIRSQGGAS